jgi:two-component sensor histidine kinase
MYRHHRVSPRGRVKPARATPITVGLALLSLPPEVQAALGWVVREATTNVLRHSFCRMARRAHYAG